MTTKDEALNVYLEDCDKHAIVPDVGGAFNAAWNAAIKQALAAPVQEPVAWCVLEPWLSGKFEAQDCFSDVALDANVGWVPLYTTPPAAQPAPVQEPVAWQQELANILCRIHRDGGHYIAEHGWRKAIDDADLKVAHLNATFDTTPPAAQTAPVQEPVAVMELYASGWDLIESVDIDWLQTLPFGTKLYTTPPAVQRQWVGLTPEEVDELDCVKIMWQDYEECEIHGIKDFARDIEAKLKEKNNG